MTLVKMKFTIGVASKSVAVKADSQLAETGNFNEQKHFLDNPAAGVSLSQTGMGWVAGVSGYPTPIISDSCT